MTTPKVTLSTPANIAAAVPALVGFTPDDGDFAVIVFGGKRLQVTLRVAHPGTAMLGRLAQSIAPMIRNGAPLGDAVTVVAWNGAVGDAYELLARLADEGFTPMMALTVQGQRVLVEPSFDTADAHWADLDVDGGPVGTASVVTGQVLAASRDELLQRVAWTGRWTPGNPDNQVVAGNRWALRDIPARDEFLARVCRMEGDDLRITLEQLLLTARFTGPGDDRNVVVTVAAWAAYLAGDGALTRICLEQVEGAYSLAALLTAALDACAPPDMLRAAGMALPA